MKPLSLGSASVTRRTWLQRMAVAAAVTACSWRGRAATSSGTDAAGLTDPQREALRAVMKEAIAKKRIPGGSLVLLSRGRVVFREAFGRAEFETERAFTPEAPCFIASLTKPISATFFVMLDERGVISLDDPVDKYLPEFKGIRIKGQGAAVTTLRVWHLLSHRSGLPGNADLGEARPQRLANAGDDPAEGPAAGALGNSLEAVVARWVQDGLLAEPGARFGYGSSGYMVAARIAEVVMGRRFERLLREHLLDPLRMNKTTFHPAPEMLAQLPARYLPSPEGPQRDTRRMPLPAPDGLINPAGGLCSRLDDMAAFMALHLNRGMMDGKRLVAGQSLARMYRPHPPRTGGVGATDGAEEAGYGLGWNVMAGGFVRHLGASGTMAWLNLKREHAGVLLTQVKWGAARPLIQALMKEVQAIFPTTE